MQPITYASAEAFLADGKRPRFDCLVLDVQLGGMSGIDLARQLAAAARHAPFIFITAHDDAQTRASAQAPDAPAYFRKNESGADMLAAIRGLAG